jgi:hypothetical protein
MKRFRLSTRLQTVTIGARSQEAAEQSAIFEYLMGLGPIFELVTVTEVIPEPFTPDPYR